MRVEGLRQDAGRWIWWWQSRGKKTVNHSRLYIFIPSNPNIPVPPSATDHVLEEKHFSSRTSLRRPSNFGLKPRSFVILRSKICHELTALHPRPKLGRKGHNLLSIVKNILDIRFKPFSLSITDRSTAVVLTLSCSYHLLLNSAILFPD